jgi:hypothetical protein
MLPDTVKEQDAQAMITLAALCYESVDQLHEQLVNENLATRAEWSVVWGPAAKDRNLAYVVRREAAKGHDPVYAVAIRGTVGSLKSILEDADVFTQVPPPWQPDGVPMLAHGMGDGWQHLTSVNSPEGAPGAGQTLGEFLSAVSSGSTVFVTGHSQGGALSSVLAVWIKNQRPDVNVVPYTFAAETAGNDAFAAHFDDLFLGKPGGRFFHHLDVVPKGFVVSELETIRTLYAPEPPGVNATLLVDGALKILIDAMKVAGVTYRQCGNPVVLDDRLIPCHDVHLLSRESRLQQEVGAQHSSYTYVALVGAPQLPSAPDPWPPPAVPYDE